MPSLSIFSSKMFFTLARSIQAHFSKRDRLTFLWGVVFAIPSLAVAVLSPIEVISSGFLRTNPIRVVHNPVTAPKPGFCEVTEDGLVHFPADIMMQSSILVVGNSHSDWFMYPQWIEQEGRTVGHRIAVFSVARPACSVIEMLDTIIYFLRTTTRHFNAILVKPANPFFDDIAHPFDRENTDPVIGSGFSVIHTGMPLDGPPFSWISHSGLMIQKRKTDLVLIERTRRMKQMHDRTLPGKDVELVTQVPSAVQELMDKERERYEKVLMEMMQVCKTANIPLIFMTTPGRLFDLSAPETLALVQTTPAFFNRFSLLGINQQLSEQFSACVRRIAKQAGSEVIDTEALAYSLPKEKNHYRDFVHLDFETEKIHGRFVYQRLREMGL